MSEADLRERDERARHAARTDFERPLVVAAGAGTGKTSTLVGRIATFALGLGWERADEARDDRERAREVLSRIGAITFTELAAAEMASRLVQDLQRLARSERPVWWPEEEFEPDAERARRAELLAESIDALEVNTIHGFCAQLLRRYGSAIGLHPNPEIDAESAAVRTAVREAVEESLAENYGERLDPDHLVLARAGKGPRAIEEALTILVEDGVREAEIDGEAFAGSQAREFVCELLANCSRLAGALPSDPSEIKRASNVKKLVLVLAELEDASLELAAGGFASLRESVLFRPSSEVTGDEQDRLLGIDLILKVVEEWAKGKVQKAVASVVEPSFDLEGISASLREPLRFLKRCDPEGYAAACRVLRPLVSTVRTTLVRRGAFTFDDLLREAARLVRENDAVRRRIQASLDLLLVDEFQDTDDRQCDLVEALAFGGDPDDPRPNLFVVGDPKQSIYSWRAADLGAYDGFLGTVRDHEGEVLDLVVNFRSRQQVLDEVERTLAHSFELEEGYQPEFVPLLARAGHPGTAPDPLEARPAIEMIDLVPEEQPAEPDGEGQGRQRGTAQLSSGDATALDARYFAAEAAEVIEAGLEPGAIGLLVRTGSDVAVYAEALRERGVPFELGRDKGYYQRREVIDATALVRCILDPTDEVALVAALRSSIAGVPDAAWLPLRAAGLFQKLRVFDGTREVEERDREDLADVVARAAGATPDSPGIERIPHWPAALRVALGHLVELRRLARTVAAEDFVDQLRTRTLLEATESARFQGAQRAANLERFFSELRESLEDSDGDFLSALAELRRAVRERREASEARLSESGGKAVRVLTIHASKGLEFEWVHLAQTHKGDGSGGPGRPEARTSSTGERTALELFGWPEPAVAAAQARAAKTAACERVRLLYVAMTRARSRLSMARCSDRAPSGPSAAKSLQDLLALRHPRLETDPEANVARTRIDHVERVPGRRPERPSAEASAEDLAAAVRNLEERRARARERAGRRPFGAISREKSRIGGLEELDEDDLGLAESGAARSPAGTGVDPLVAVAVGTALHRLLEDFRASDLPAPERVAPDVATFLADSDPARLAAAREEFDRGLARLRENGVLERLAGLEDRIVGRELPVLVPRALAGRGETGPLEGYVGSIDLVYRDGETWVVVDYKSDRGERRDPAEHAGQLELYALALGSAFELPTPPRCEIWYLEDGRSEPL